MPTAAAARGGTLWEERRCEDLLRRAEEHLLINRKAGKRKQRDGQPDPLARADRARQTAAVGAYRKATTVPVSLMLSFEENGDFAWAKELLLPPPSQGELLQVMDFSGESVTGDPKEIMVVLAALVAAGYVWRRELLKCEKTPHEKITKCIIILTSVVPRGLPMQMSLAVKAALMSLHSAGVFSTEPFRVLMAGKVTQCLFDKTGTLTTEELVPAGVCESRRFLVEGQGWDASVESSLVLSTCQALVSDGLTLAGDTIEVGALDPNENTARPRALSTSRESHHWPGGS